MVITLALVMAGCSLQPNIASVSPNGRIGTTAPPLAGESLERTPLKIDFHQGRTVLVFWAAWCGPCRHEQPSLNALAASLAPQGIRFYGVEMLDHDRALARAFTAEFKVPYPSLYDPSGTAAAGYEVDAPPSIVLVNERGVVVGRIPGEVSESQLRALITKDLT